MVIAPRIAIAALCAQAIAQGCPRPIPPASGFETQVDAVVPVTYTDGYQTFGSLTWPTVAPPSCMWPLVVFVHPLGGSRADDLGLQMAIAAQGYAVWSYDVRGQGQALAQNVNHPNPGTTLWGPVEICDLAEQIQFIGTEASYVGIIDATRVAVVGSSQGGAHAWSAAAWSELPLTVEGRPPLTFPEITCVAANDYAAETTSDWLRGGTLWSSWFVEALAGSYAGLPIDGSFLQATRNAFITQDPQSLLSLFAAEGRMITAKLAASDVPVLYSHSYHDRIDSPLLGLQAMQSMSAPRRAVLGTGGHNSPVNTLERSYRDAVILRWLHRWMWGEPNEVDVEEPFVLAEMPLDPLLRGDPSHSWSRHHGGDPLSPATSTRLFLHDDYVMRETVPSQPQGVEVLEQVIDPVALLTPQSYLTDPLVRDLNSLLVVCPLDEVVYTHLVIDERQLDASAVLHLRVVPQAPDWMISALLTVEPDVPAAGEVMLSSGSIHGTTSVPGMAEDHTLVLPPVAARLPAGATVRLRLRTLWLREQPMARQLEVAPRFHDFRVDVVHDDAVGASYLDLPLHEVRPKISSSSSWFELATAPPLTLHVRGGTARANQPYYITFGVSGHLPSTPFLNDVMPLESDWLVGIITSAWLQPEFVHFLYELDSAGEATAVVDFSGHAPLPPELTGLRLSFAAFVFDSIAGVSGAATNPCDVVLR